jgi:2-hydroxycyclohexanecarboxyl-CoA dehydrogenase
MRCGRDPAHARTHCTVVAPGPADTPLTRQMRAETDLTESVPGAMEDQIPLGRLTDPGDVAAVAYFASDDAGVVTGQVLSVSGGPTM